MHVYFPSLLRVPVARSMWCPDVGSKTIHSPVKESGSLEKWPIPGLGQGAPKMGLGALVVSEHKEVLKNTH